MSTAVDIVKSYLSAMERRDLDTARSFLAPGFTMIFPGGAEFSTPEQLVEWSRPRYRSVAKHYDHFDEMVAGDNGVVYCFGTLFGEWPDGEPFSGIRFIDRFELSDGKITGQRVWNDMGEARLAGTS
ncbi:MAG: nuclear transport factor 2 family protein [Rhizobiaceae bacterium]